ncbi:MAG: hypothetical protein HC802_11880 [Caldilineaceae bacterium]|nr:hypothetical protein [Caldilineaceae bacterium]
MTNSVAPSSEVQTVRRVIALLRVTLGVILLVTWYDNFTKGVYTADGILGLFNYLFNDNGGGPEFYRALINGTILQAPGLFAGFQMVGELLLGLGLLFGGLTMLSGLGATFFFFNLFLAYFGGSEWIWTYVLLMVSSFVVALTRSGRAFGIDHYLVKKFGEPRVFFLW